jgi:linoleate 10R-lipoxygenase
LFKLTSWGYQYCKADVHDGAYGGILTKLLFNTLPDYYPPGSVRALFPFLTPTKVRAFMSKRKEDLTAYDWGRPSAPVPPVPVRSLMGVRSVLARGGAFGPGSKGFPALTKKVPVDVNIIERVLLEEKWVSNWAQKLGDIVGDLIKSKTFTTADSSVGHLDIVQSVLNYLPVALISNDIV